MVIPSFSNEELGTATRSNVNVSVPALATIFKPVDPEAKFNVPCESSAINAVPLKEAVTKADCAVTEVKYPASLFS